MYHVIHTDCNACWLCWLRVVLYYQALNSSHNYDTLSMFLDYVTTLACILDSLSTNMDQVTDVALFSILYPYFWIVYPY